MANDNVATKLYDNGQKVDPETLQFFRALQDADKGHSICKKIINDNIGRIGKDAAIMRKYNDEQPWNQNELNAAGQGWRNNRATGFMSSLVRRALHPYKQVIDLAKYLTDATLPEEVENWNEKSEEFQLETTRVVRSWKNWNNFTFSLILEDVLFGHAQILWTDALDWQPLFGRSDNALFADGTGQNADSVPLIVFKQHFQIHQLAKYLRNPQISTAAGWNVEKLVSAINNAQPENKQKGTADNARKVEDALRETTLGRTYSQGVNVVETVHLFIQEATGKVSHYLYNNQNGDLLFKYEDQFENMCNCVRLFTLEVGNGTIYGSKGAGRTLYNSHIAIEQSRNLIADALYLSGLLILKTTTPNKKRVALTVVHPFCVVGEGYEIVDFSFKVNSDAFFELDRHMTSLAEIQTGVFMPGMQLDARNGDVTASQINYMASVEVQLKEGLMARFKGQFNGVMAEIQRRIYSEDNIKKGIELYNLRKQTGLKMITRKVMSFMKSIAAFMGVAPGINMDKVPDMKQDDSMTQAAEAVANLMERGLNPTEIYILGLTPPDQFTDDNLQTNPGNLDIVSQRYGADASIDKEELKKLDIAQKIGQKLADRLVIPGMDQTITTEAIREQLLENMVLATGEDVPVSPRDNDQVHLDVVMQTAGKVLKTANEKSITPFSLDVISKFVGHMDNHLQAALAKGEKPEKFKVEMEFIKTAKEMVAHLQGALPSTPQGGGATLPAGTSPHIPDQVSDKMQDASATPEETPTGVPVGAVGTSAASAINKPLSRQAAVQISQP